MPRSRLILAAVLVVPSLLLAQPGTGWEKVKTLPADKDVRVRMTGGRIVRGTFQSATDDVLVVETDASQESLHRLEIDRVAQRGKNHRLRNAAIGLGVGAGAGLAIGVGVDSGCAHNCLLGNNLGKEILTPFGAVVGLLAGALWPSGNWHEIYRSK